MGRYNIGYYLHDCKIPEVVSGSLIDVQWVLIIVNKIVSEKLPFQCKHEQIMHIF